jgi:deoxycytidine triphosphate deaminase
MCIWSNSRISTAIEDGTLGFTGGLRTNSLMISLGGQIQEFNQNVNPVDICDIASLKGLYADHTQVLTTYILAPQSSLLVESEEAVAMPADATGLLSGLSHIARCGLTVHLSSMFVEPGYKGHLCLEMLNTTPSPILIRRGMVVAKLKLTSMDGGVSNYQTEQDKGWYGESKSLRSQYAVEYISNDGSEQQ